MPGTDTAEAIAERSVKKILIANRGEIAVRVIRACRDLGIETVAIYADCDRQALHVRLADQAIALGGNAPAETYLHIDKIIDAARLTGAEGVHPGYGFLAENARFAARTIEAGLTFIGPTPQAIALMGSKTGARQAAVEAGAPVVPGTDGPLPATVSETELTGIAGGIGYPLLVKAVAGGGGKGMRLVSNRGELASAIRTARSEAGAAFGESAVYLERYLVGPRHIEIQLLADQYGTVVPFVERECSIQRRHQKVIEESPSLAVDASLRRRLCDAAAAVAARVRYTNAGTIEFLVDANRDFYFLEMNTRLQVEHPVTELVTGVDLVQWQIRIARGERLAIDPDSVATPRGHAIECRIYAEDPDSGFMPCPGRIGFLRAPSGPGIRDDTGVYAGFEVPIYYDSMISKLLAWGEDRPQAIARLSRALVEYELRGIKSTLPFFRWMLRQPDFLAGNFDTTTLDGILRDRTRAPFEQIDDHTRELAVMAAALHAYFDASSAGPRSRPTSTASNAWTLAARQEGLRR